MRRRKIGCTQQIQKRLGLIIAKMLPKRNTFAVLSPFIEFVLRPAKEGRDQQRGEVKVVIWLQHKPDAGHQILHHYGRIECQPVHTRNWDPCLVQTRNNRPCQFSALAHQDQDISRFRISRLIAQSQPILPVSPILYFPSNIGGQFQLGISEPLFLRLFALLFGLLGPDGRPQRHAA